MEVVVGSRPFYFVNVLMSNTGVSAFVYQLLTVHFTHLRFLKLRFAFEFWGLLSSFFGFFVLIATEDKG